MKILRARKNLKSVAWKVYEPSSEVGQILIFNNNCIFLCYEKQERSRSVNFLGGSKCICLFSARLIYFEIRLISTDVHMNFHTPSPVNALATALMRDVRQVNGFWQNLHCQIRQINNMEDIFNQKSLLCKTRIYELFCWPGITSLEFHAYTYISFTKGSLLSESIAEGTYCIPVPDILSKWLSKSINYLLWKIFNLHLRAYWGECEMFFHVGHIESLDANTQMYSFG